MELINKQYALASAISGIVITDENGGKWIRVRDVRESIINVPTIEAEPNSCEYWDSESHFCALHRPQADSIVHCSKCKHGKWLARCNNVLQCDFDVFGQICLDGDDYCSWGEKKDEVTE